VILRSAEEKKSDPSYFSDAISALATSHSTRERRDERASLADSVRSARLVNLEGNKTALDSFLSDKSV
jgi:hypothetical protein